MVKKASTKAERAWMGLVAETSCACCDASPPVSVHHIREGVGMAQRSSHYLTVGLCWQCHQGPLGVHGDGTLMRIHKTDELKMLAYTIDQVFDAIS